LPWKERKALDEKKHFIEEWNRQDVSWAELCRRYEISRQTGYWWLERYEQEGEPGLEENSRAPLNHPQAMAPRVREALVGLRSQHSSWGPRKRRAYLQRESPRMVWPATSSIGDLLRREGLYMRREILSKLRMDGTYSEEPPLPHGVFGSMGGLLTTATDLGRYVAFHLSAWPPRDDAEAGR
jgi:putative transposase